MGEICRRCGHRSGGCPRCGRNDSYLGARANDSPLCHLPDGVGMSCYHVETVYGGREPNGDAVARLRDSLNEWERRVYRDPSGCFDYRVDFYPDAAEKASRNCAHPEVPPDILQLHARDAGEAIRAVFAAFPEAKIHNVWRRELSWMDTDFAAVIERSRP